MNANVVSGVGREEQGPLSEALMAHTVNETVYLGRASFRITHELEAVGAEDAAAASAEWFSHDSTVILKGGPNGLAVREQQTEESSDQAVVAARPTRGLRRPWMLVALPVAAFALGIGVASVVASSAARRRSVAPALATAPVRPATAIPPAIATAATAAPAVPTQAAPAGPVTMVVPQTAAAVVVPAATLPPSTIALTAPVMKSAAAPAAEPEADAHPALAPRVVRPALKPRVARKAKAPGADLAAGESPIVGTDDAPAAEVSPPPAAAPKKAAVKWVDPWAN